MPRGELAKASLPDGARVVADPTLEWLDAGLVAGGSPWRLLQLTPQGAERLASWLDGTPLDGDAKGRALARRMLDAGMLHLRSVPRAPRTDELSVIVPVRDDVDGLRSLLGLLAEDGLDVTVVDDGSRRADDVAAAARAAGAVLVRHERARGPAAARNTGVLATTTPLVAFVDADVRPEAGWLHALVPVFDDASVGAVAPRVRGPGGPGPRDRFEAVASPLDLGARTAVVRPGAAVPFVPSAALLARRAALADGFDESLRTGEDVDLVWRLVDGGWLVRYEPSVTVAHAARSSWRAWVAQRVAYGRSAAALEQRHGDAAAPLRADPRVLATLLLVLAGKPRAAAGLLAWSAAALARQLEASGLSADVRDAARRLAARGTVLAAPGLARSAFRAYGPLLVAVAVVVPPARRPILVLAATATAVRWWRSGRPVDASFPLLSVADDLAYGTGVVAGVIRARRVGALRPRLGPWLRRPSGLSRT